MEQSSRNHLKFIFILAIGIIVLFIGYLLSDYRLSNKMYSVAIVAITYGLLSLALDKFFLSDVIQRARKKPNYILAKYKASNMAFWVTFWSNTILYVISDLLVISIRQLAIYLYLLMIMVYLISFLIYYKRS